MTNGQEPPPPSSSLPPRPGHAPLTPELRNPAIHLQAASGFCCHTHTASPLRQPLFTAGLFSERRRCSPGRGRDRRESLCNSPARPNVRPRLCRVSSLAYLPGLCLPGYSAFLPFILPVLLPHLPPAYIYLYHLLPPPRVPLAPPPASHSPPLYRHSPPGNTASFTSPHPLFCVHETSTNTHAY